MDNERMKNGRCFNAIFKFFQVDSAVMFCLTSSARYFKQLALDHMLLGTLEGKHLV
jgi:hypothetical protein